MITLWNHGVGGRIGGRWGAGLLGGVLLLTSGSCCLLPPTADVGLYGVRVEAGTRRTKTDERIAYSLYIPQPADGLPPPPWPAVVLSHGFARSKELHRDNARYLAERGLVVLTPNLTDLLCGEPCRTRNVENLVEHVNWLAERSRTVGDALFGVLDPNRIGLAGHSAGGAISFEAALDTQSGPTPVAALCLLDAVPWERTLARAADVPPIPLATFRSEPSPCNADGAVRELLALLPVPVDDVRIIGATHCDPENPTDLACRLICGGSPPAARELYRQLLYQFAGEALQSPLIQRETENLGQMLDELEAANRVARTRLAD